MAKQASAKEKASAMNFQTEFARHLRRNRLALGLTLDALAKLSGTTKGYLSLIENGHSVPTIGIAAEIMRAVGLRLVIQGGRPRSLYRKPTPAAGAKGGG